MIIERVDTSVYWYPYGKMFWRIPDVVDIENQISPLGSENFGYDFINKSVSNCQYDRDCTISNDYKWLLIDLIPPHVDMNTEIPRKWICINPCSI